MQSLIKIFILLIIIINVACVFDILKFGAVPNSDIISDQFKNKHAI